eukprot:SAG31_NODE_18644_length_628_cov_0.956522_1_plen_100_part_00
MPSSGDELIFLYFQISAGFEFGAELTWPVPEERSAGLLNISAQGAGIVFISGLQHFMDVSAARQGSVWANWIQVAIMCLGLLLAACCRGSLRRLESEAV